MKKSLLFLFDVTRYLVAIPLFCIGLWFGIQNWCNIYIMFFTKAEYGSIIPLVPAMMMFLAAFICHNANLYRLLPLFFLLDVTVLPIALCIWLKQAYEWLMGQNKKTE